MRPSSVGISQLLVDENLRLLHDQVDDFFKGVVAVAATPLTNVKFQVRVKVDSPPAVLGRRRLDFEHGGELRIPHVLEALSDLIKRGVVFLEQSDRFESKQCVGP